MWRGIREVPTVPWPWGMPPMAMGVPQYLDGFCWGKSHLEMDDEHGFPRGKSHENKILVGGFWNIFYFFSKGNDHPN